MSTAQAWLSALAVGLVLLAGLLVDTETALARVSRVTVDEIVREGRRGAKRLAEVVADPARYVNMVLLLRIGCELVATVIVADLCISWLDETWRAYVTAAAIMIVVSYVVIGVGPRTLGIQHAGRIALAAPR